MIISGKKSRIILTENTLERCAHCNTSKNLTLSVLQNYFHFFWIPFIPLNKTGETECGHCKKVLRLKEFPTSYKFHYRNLKSRAKTPIWSFSGILLLAFFVSIGLYNHNERYAKMEVYIVSPQRGDVYEIRQSFRNYTLYKIDEVDVDTVFMLVNDFEVTKISKLDDLKDQGDAAYSTDPVPFLKSDLKTMLEKGKINDIDRE